MSLKIGWIGRGTFFKEIHNHLKRDGVDSHNFMATVHRRPIDVLINYGLQGAKLDAWLRDDRDNANLYSNGFVLNIEIYGNKYSCCCAVKGADVPVPDMITPREYSRMNRTQMAGLVAENFIVKPIWSFGGRRINEYRGQAIAVDEYLQRRIVNRRYELRVHAMGWLPQSEWLVAKKTHPQGEEQLTWNFHTGGVFANIEQAESNTGVFKRAKEYAAKAMKALRYDFCSVDFIVANASGGPLPVYFIEANLATGFTTDRTREFYLDAFDKLSRMSIPALKRALRQTTPVAETPTTPPPVQRTQPACAPPRRLTEAQIIGLIRMLTTSTSLSREAVINYINNMQ
jgi:hypothetical protein